MNYLNYDIEDLSILLGSNSWQHKDEISAH